MKILHVNDQGAVLGGTEVYLHALMHAQREEKHEPVLVHDFPGAEQNGVRFVRVPDLTRFRSAAGSSPLRAFQTLVDRERPDVVHFHTHDNPALIRLARSMAPTVRTVHNHNDYSAGGMKFLRRSQRACERKFGPLCLAYAMVERCNTVRPAELARSYARTGGLLESDRELPVLIAASEYVRGCLIQNGVAGMRVHRLPYFTDPVAETAPHRDARRILFVGRLTRTKGVDLLLRAVRKIRTECRLTVVGDGPDLRRLRRLAAQLDLETRVEFKGWVPRQDHSAIYRDTAVSVVPSLWPEPFGIVGLEAMARAIPVVAFNVGGIGEWLQHEVTGYAVEPYNADDLARRLEHLVTDPAHRARMGEAAQQRARRDFSPQAHLQRLAQLYTAASS
jgi:glycosyltransferase involved in cell wall biosynthesis